MQAVTALLSRPAARFLVTGAGGAVLLFTLIYAFARAGMQPFAASTLAYVLCFVTVYLVHRNWTFPGRAPHARALPRYFAIQLACALFSGGVAHGLVARFGLDAAAMSLATTIAASTFSYFASSLWAFAAHDA